jgi:hypothetical protein
MMYATMYASDDVLSIPPALDRALARTVLDDLRAVRTASPGDAPSPALAATVEGVVDALRAQGARASEVMLAVEDAFAALLAGQRDAVVRGRVQALDDQARQLVAGRLGYGA